MFPLLALLTHKHPPQPPVLSLRISIRETSLFGVKVLARGVSVCKVVAALEKRE